MSAEFLATAASIYAGYAPYAQGAGNEQRVFSESGTSDVRSKRLADFLAGQMRIPSSGTLVDFGCGSGVFIREFLARNPNWSAVGVDPAMHLADAVNAIPRAAFVGRLDEALGMLALDQSVVVSMIHSLEHVESPRQTLSDISATFPNASLLVQVPDARTNPFDIAVADHRMHFTRDSLDELLGSVFGPRSSRVIEGLVAKELTAIVAPGLGAPNGPGGRIDVAHRIGMLSRFLKDVRTIAGESPVSIFGSSIAASWVAGSLPSGSVAAFVDEDESRIGRRHLDIPIVSPAQLAPESMVVMPFDRRIGSNLRERLGLRPERTLCFDSSPSPI